MLPAEVLSRVVAVQPVLDAIERDQAAPHLAFEQLTVGQAVSGLIRSQTNGVSMVMIAGQTVAMRLPRTVAVGDTLKLKFAGNMPQPVFLLDLPEAPETDAPQFSQTARMLSDIMQRVPERGLPTLAPPTPLLDLPPAQPAELALALRTAVVRSGLFYESHLANWVMGEDTVEGLMREPQNRPPARSVRAASAAPAEAADARRDLLALPAVADAAGTVENKPLSPTHALLSQQLQVLESSHFAWRGELWPGHPVEWQVRQETEAQTNERPATAVVAPPEAGWESHLKLTLPQLGTVNVHIRLDAHQAFSIRMVPDEVATAPLLQKNQPRLVEKLTAAGCTLHTVMVQRDGGH